MCYVTPFPYLGRAADDIEARCREHRGLIVQPEPQPADRRLIVPTRSFHRETGAQAMRELLQLRNPPDAVFCYNDLIAAGAIRVLLTAGLRVPEDVAVAGFDDIEEGRYSTPTLTSLAPDKRRIAAMAVEQLFRRIEGLAGDPEVLQAPFSLQARESTLGRAAVPVAG